MLPETTLIPELLKVQQRLADCTARVRQSFEGLNPSQLRWKPDLKNWSIEQCLNHLCQVAGLLIPRMDSAIRQAVADKKLGGGPFHYPLFDRLFIYALEPTALMKQKAPGIYQPQIVGDASSLSRFYQVQQQLDGLLNSANGLDLRAVKIASPVSSLIRVSLGGWFEATAAHESNHIQQAQQVLAAPGFPRT